MFYFGIYILLVFIVFIAIQYGQSSFRLFYQNTKEKKETLESIRLKLESKVLDQLKPNLNSLNLSTYPESLVFIGLKQEQMLEVYAFTPIGYQLLKKYPFSGYSGKLGPKLQKGDKQIPEGIYYIEYLNPNSKYYLSLKINYPNAFDVSRSRFNNADDIGNDIFIHGKEETVGCIPIGDEAIEEVFMLAMKANKHKLKVVISPKDFRVDDTDPVFEHIGWEKELYQNIKEEMHSLSFQSL